MKGFLKSFAFFVLPVLLLAVGAEVFLRLIPNDYRNKRLYLETNSPKIKALFLGNSHALYDINPEYITINSFNSSHVSQSLDIDLEILKKYAGRLDSLKYIVLPADYFSYYLRLDKGEEAYRIKNYKLYHQLPIGDNITDNFELLSTPFKLNANRLFSYCFTSNKPTICTPLGWATDYEARYSQNIQATGEYAAGKHYIKDKSLYPELVKATNEIIDFAQQQNIRVMLITYPASKAYIQHLDSAQLNKTISTAKELEGKFNNVTYLNMLTDTAFTDADFYDGDHMNDIGAKKFSLKLNAILSELEHPATEQDTSAIRP